MKKNQYKNASLRKKVLVRRLNKHHEANIPLNILCSMSLKGIRDTFNPHPLLVPDTFSEKETKKNEEASFISWNEILTSIDGISKMTMRRSRMTDERLVVLQKGAII